MLYERRLDSFSALTEEAKNMDADAGLRVLGRYNGRGCYVFVTRFGQTYTAMVYESLSDRRRSVGRRLAVMEPLGIKELQSLQRKLTPGQVIGFSY